MVQRLQTRVAAGALFALVHRVPGIALHLFGSAFHYPHQDTFASRTLAAEGGVPVVPAFNQVFRLHNRALKF